MQQQARHEPGARGDAEKALETAFWHRARERYDSNEPDVAVIRIKSVANEKYLAVIGLSEEDTAHLRLLLRKLAGNLPKTELALGTKGNTNLIIITPVDLAGQT